MDRLDFDDVELTFELHDGGERIVFVHASAFVSWYRPLLEELDGYGTLVYRRHLRQPADGRYRPLTVEEDAATCVRLLDHVGWSTAHVVGHSYGALIAMRLAVDAPGRISSVALLEPAARGISSATAVAEALRPVVAAYRSGDTAGALDGFLRHVCGDGYRGTLERVIPGAFADALAEADLFFQAEMPAVQQFTFGSADVQRVRLPILNVVGADTVPRFVEGSALLQSWFPNADRLTVADAGHLLMVQNAPAVARGLTDFITRHDCGSARGP